MDREIDSPGWAARVNADAKRTVFKPDREIVLFTPVEPKTSVEHPDPLRVQTEARRRAGFGRASLEKTYA